MNKIISVDQAIEISNSLKRQGKKIVICGGVFDIIHLGHIKFLEEAGKQGDILFLLVESDKKVKETKGNDRPVNNQELRVINLSLLKNVSFVIPLPFFETNNEYDQLVVQIKPDIIATTNPDPFLFHKERQAKMIGAKVVEVINLIPNISTTEILKK